MDMHENANICLEFSAIFDMTPGGILHIAENSRRAVCPCWRNFYHNRSSLVAVGILWEKMKDNLTLVLMNQYTL